MADASDGTHQKLEAALSNLQPLRDLAKNWDVDIASCLEDYLQDIVGLDPETAAGAASLFTSDGVPNFAQAALLLQNSSNVYGRKVEYLYALVYAALNDLASSSATAKQPKKKGNDIDIDDFDAFDPDVQFLLLDDILPTDKTEGGDKINLHDSSVDLYDNDPNSSLVSLVSRPSVSGTRLSLGGLSVTHMDRSATQIGNTAAAVRTLMSSLNRGGGDAGGGNLRILSDRSDVNHAGILHLPGTAIQSSSQKDPRQSNLGSEALMSKAEGHSSVNEQEDMGGAFFDDGDDNDGPGFEMNDNMDVVKPAEAASAHPKLVKFQLPEKPDKADPWSLLDPHDPGPTKGRPIKIGITYKLPLGLEETPSQCVTGASTKKRPVRRLQERPAIKESICFVTATFKATMENGRRRRERMDGSRVISDDSSAHSDDLKIKADAVVLERPVVPIHGLVFGEEFAYIAKAEAKRKASERRDRRKLLVEHPTAVPDKEADALLGYNDHDENGVDFDFGGADDDSFGGDDDGESNQPAMGNTGMASLDDMYCKPDGDVTNTDGAAFEELCRAHIRAFAKGAENYATKTNLTKRVEQWQSRLAPILEEEERRPEFDIYKYGARVINGVQIELLKRNNEVKLASSAAKQSNVINFHAITRNCEQYEVCRLFLASLSLSNSGNVIFTSETGKVMTPDSLQIQLLESNVDRPMETFLAPSAAAIAAVDVN